MWQWAMLENLQSPPAASFEFRAILRPSLAPGLLPLPDMAASDVSIIPGLHFFCDHRCWRCPLAHRCQVPIRMAQSPVPTDPRAGPTGRVAAVVMSSLHVTIEQVGVVMAALPSAAGAIPPVNAEEPDNTEAQRQEAARDPMVAKAKEYASSSLRVLQTLRSRTARLRDAEATDAVERLEEVALTIASKTYRAVSSALENGDLHDPQGDSNGSAKVALLLIEESRQAWRLLMRPGRAVANGAPARFVLVLEDLERLLHSRFPRALEFVRPGFDTADAGPGAQVARALLECGDARHRA